MQQHPSFLGGRMITTGRAQADNVQVNAVNGSKAGRGSSGRPNSMMTVLKNSRDMSCMRALSGGICTRPKLLVTSTANAMAPSGVSIMHGPLVHPRFTAYPCTYSQVFLNEPHKIGHVSLIHANLVGLDCLPRSTSPHRQKSPTGRRREMTTVATLAVVGSPTASS
jgi:hypothetical protein